MKRIKRSIRERNEALSEVSPGEKVILIGRESSWRYWGRCVFNSSSMIGGLNVAWIAFKKWHGWFYRNIRSIGFEGSHLTSFNPLISCVSAPNLVVYFKPLSLHFFHLSLWFPGPSSYIGWFDRRVLEWTSPAYR